MRLTLLCVMMCRKPEMIASLPARKRFHPATHTSLARCMASPLKDELIPERQSRINKLQRIWSEPVPETARSTLCDTPMGIRLSSCWTLRGK